jgi:hypothetical protein
MHATLPRAVLFLSTLLAACASTPSTSEQDFAAAPMGESAMSTTPPVMAYALTATQPIQHRWFDGEGNEWQALLYVHCESDTAHHELARMCLLVHWPLAVARCREVLSRVEASPTYEALLHRDADLQQALNSVLFPCELQDPVGKVTHVEWKSVTMRRRGHGMRHQVMQPKR